MSLRPSSLQLPWLRGDGVRWPKQSEDPNPGLPCPLRPRVVTSCRRLTNGHIRLDLRGEGFSVLGCDLQNLFSPP